MHLPWCPVPVAPRRISVPPPAPVPALHRQLGLLRAVVQLPAFVYEHFTPLSPHTLNAAGSHVSPVLRAAGRGQPGALVVRVGRRQLVGNLFIASQLTMPCPDGVWSATHCIACLAAVPIRVSTSILCVHPPTDTLCAAFSHLQRDVSQPSLTSRLPHAIRRTPSLGSIWRKATATAGALEGSVWGKTENLSTV